MGEGRRDFLERAGGFMGATILPGKIFEHSFSRELKEAEKTFQQIKKELEEGPRVKLSRVDKMGFHLDESLVYWDKRVEELRNQGWTAEETVDGLQSQNIDPMEADLSVARLVQKDEYKIELIGVNYSGTDLDEKAKFLEQQLEEYYNHRLRYRGEIDIEVETRKVDGEDEVAEGIEKTGSIPKTELNEEFRDDWTATAVYLVNPRKALTLGSYNGIKDAAIVEVDEKAEDHKLNPEDSNWAVVHEAGHASELIHNPYPGRIHEAPVNLLRSEILLKGDLEYNYVAGTAIEIDFEPGDVKEYEAIEEFKRRFMNYFGTGNSRSLGLDLGEYQIDYGEKDNGNDIAILKHQKYGIEMRFEIGENPQYSFKRTEWPKLEN